MQTKDTTKYIPKNITIRSFEETDKEVKVTQNWVWSQAYWNGKEHILLQDIPVVKGIPAFPFDTDAKRPASVDKWTPQSHFHANVEKPVEITFENTPKRGYRVIDMSWRKDDIAWRVICPGGRIYDLRNDTFTELFFRGKIGKGLVIDAELQFVKNGSQMRLEDTSSFRYSRYFVPEDRVIAQAENKELRKQHEKNKRAARIQTKDLVVGRFYSADFDYFSPRLYLGESETFGHMWLNPYCAKMGKGWIYFYNIGEKVREATLHSAEVLLTQELFFEHYLAEYEEQQEKLNDQLDLCKKGGETRPYLEHGAKTLLSHFECNAENTATPNLWPSQKTLYDLPPEQLEKIRNFLIEAYPYK